ncbi:MAG: class I SAM-dependent methyltransferase [Dehalococcoidia bacterium]|nr:class I SAM-dependent methyltransferase [Dehalococcoidia bacterium]
MLSLNAPGEYDRFLLDGALRPRLARAVALADVRPGQWVLDLGCGRGETARHCARSGCRVLGVDYSRDCLLLTSETAKSGGGDLRGEVVLVQGDGNALPVRTGSMSRVLMFDVIEHLCPTEAEVVLSEVRRVLEPGGYLVVHTLPNRWALDIGYRWARFFLRSLPSEPRSEREQTIHVNEQDIQSLNRLLVKVGFKARVWLEDSILAQARWQQGGQAFSSSDLRAKAYPFLVNPFLRTLYRLALATPLRLVLANDIFAVAFKGEFPKGSGWGRWLERLLARISSASGKGE